MISFHQRVTDRRNITARACKTKPRCYLPEKGVIKVFVFAGVTTSLRAWYVPAYSNYLFNSGSYRF